MNVQVVVTGEVLKYLHNDFTINTSGHNIVEKDIVCTLNGYRTNPSSIAEITYNRNPQFSELSLEHANQY